MVTEKQILNAIAENKQRQAEADFRRIPMEVEQRLMNNIREGKHDEIRLAHFDRINVNLGLMAKDPLTHCSYFVVAAITLFSRVAIEGGASPDDAFDLSDALTFYVSCCKNFDELSKLYQLAAVMFAKLVSSAKEKKHSQQVERIINYISRNIYAKISLAELSEYTGLSLNYMCGIFSNEIKISIHNYIQREKVAVSCNMLKYSDRSISEIALYMGFQTQSNFSSVFKKWMNTSPSEYRKANHLEVF